jgi:hypothetical protein
MGDWTILIKVEGGYANIGEISEGEMTLNPDMFPRDVEIKHKVSGPEDAVRIAWDSLKKEFLEGLTAEELFAFEDSTGLWNILSDGKTIGRLKGNGTAYFDEVGGDWEISDINFGKDIKNAMRYMWLKTHS